MLCYKNKIPKNTVAIDSPPPKDYSNSCNRMQPSKIKIFSLDEEFGMNIVKLYESKF
jgi:hypothetical protein